LKYLSASATCDADCTAVTCGDGTTNTSAGEACDDSGESVTCDPDCTTATCGDGTTNPSAGETCDDGNVENGDCCSATCIAVVDCVGAVCVGGPLPTTADGGSCRVAERSALSLIADTRGGGSIRWKWKKGEAVSLVDLGDPLTDTTYTLCFYDSEGAVFYNAMPDLGPGPGFEVLPGEPGWHAQNEHGYRHESSPCEEGGTLRVHLRTGGVGRSKVALKLKGACIPMPGDMPDDPARYFYMDPSVSVRLISSDNVCWASDFDDRVFRNSDLKFKTTKKVLIGRRRVSVE
jgi:cysteine-rich repeat protein